VIPPVVICAVLALLSLSTEEQYLAGHKAESAKAHGTAAQAFQTCVNADDALRHYAELRLTRNAFRSAPPVETISAYQAMLDQMPEGPWRRMAFAELAEWLHRDKQYHAASEAFARLLAVDHHPWWMQRYFTLSAESLILGNTDRAEGYRRFRQIAEMTIYIQPRLDAARRLLPSPDADDRAAAIFAMLRSNAQAEAGKALLTAAPMMRDAAGNPIAFTEILQQLFPASPATSEADLDRVAEANAESAWLRLLLLYGVRQLALNQRDAASAVVCDQLMSRYLGTAEAGEGGWWLARHLEDKGLNEEAMARFRAFVDACPDDRRAGWALYRMGSICFSLGQDAEAEALLVELGAQYPDSRYRPEGFYRLARHFEEAGDQKKAALYYAEAAHNAIGNFWAHRAMGRMNSEELPVDAMHNLKVDGARPILYAYPKRPPAQPALPANILADPRMQRLAFFARHGMEEAEYEAIEILSSLRDAPDAGAWYRAIAEAGLAHSALEFANAYGWGYVEGKPTLERWRLNFPIAHRETLLTTAKEYDVDPFLALALAKQESAFRATIVSSAGATGVMQLMPATAKWLVSADASISAEHGANLNSPINSWLLGICYLRRMVNRSNGNLIHALASYNAGPGNLDKWRVRFPNHEVDEFIEAIPFNETKDYVKKVLGNYAAYHSLYTPLK
jgi:soluble lytic murein transglycosylase-like protein